MLSGPPALGEAGGPPTGASHQSPPLSPPTDSLAACISLAIFHKLARHAPTVAEYSTVNSAVKRLYAQRLRRAESACPAQSLCDLSARRIKIRGVFDVSSGAPALASKTPAPVMHTQPGYAHLMQSLKRYKRVVMLKSSSSPEAQPPRCQHKPHPTASQPAGQPLQSKAATPKAQANRTSAAAGAAGVYAAVVATGAPDVYAVYCRGRRSDVGTDKLRHALNALVSHDFTYVTFRFS
jgi:hypothetical protein